MYSTGASVAFGVNVLFAYINILPPLYSDSPTEFGTIIGILAIELINAMIPLVAVALDRPGKALLTVLVYVFVGLAVWTTNYEAGMREF